MNFFCRNIYLRFATLSDLFEISSMKLHWETQSSLSPLSHLSPSQRQRDSRYYRYSFHLALERENWEGCTFESSSSPPPWTSEDDASISCFWRHNTFTRSSETFTSNIILATAQRLHTIFNKIFSPKLFVTLLYTVQPFQHGCRAQ